MPSRSPARALSGATPVTIEGLRETFPDELRGFALLGIVFVNAPFLGISGEGFTPEAVAAWYDRAAAFAVVAFAQAKFYLLFAFLFGYSMHFWTCLCSTDGYVLRSSVFSISTGTGLSTGGVAHATQAPTVGNPCSMSGRLRACRPCRASKSIGES
jgi:hypothetical protein